MRKKLSKLLVLVLSVYSLVSCAPIRHYISDIEKSEDISQLKSKQAVITASDDVLLSDFVNTFNKNFTSKIEFSEKFIYEFKRKLNGSVLFSNVEIGGINTFDLLKESSHTDYLIYLSDFEVLNRVEWRQSAAPLGPNNFGMNHTTTVEYCVINVDVNVYDLKSKRRVHKFTAIGESSVFLFDFKKTFKKAKERAITHIINYLSSGKTLYKQY